MVYRPGLLNGEVSRMRIVCVGYVNGEGGAQRQMLMLANELANRNNEVHLFLIAGNDIRYALSDKVIVHDLTDNDMKSIHPIIGRYKAIKRMYKEIVPEVTIHYNFQSVYVSAMMKKSITGKIIYSERGDPGDVEYTGLLGLVRRIVLPRVDGFVFQTMVARDYFGESVRRKSTVIHNSVAINCTYDLTQNIERERRIVGVGRLHEQKNFPLLINAFTSISDQYPDYILEIYGEGVLRDELQKLIDKNGLNNRIVLKGARKDIHDCIYKASLFVLTSDYEGMPNALIEAMALGLPCISTDWRPGAVRGLIEDGKNGLVTSLNEVDELAAKIRYVLDNSDEAEQMGKNASKIMETHKHKLVFDKWNEFIKGVVEEK